MVSNWGKISYGFKDAIVYLLGCGLKCCWWRTIKNNKYLVRQAYFRVGQKKLKNELDCVTLIWAVWMLKVLTKTLLSENQ